MSGVPCSPARSQRGDELPHRARTEPGGTGLPPYETAKRQPACVFPHGGPRPPAHAACLTRGRSRKSRARGCAGCARFELLRPGNAPVCDGHTRERLPAAPLKSGQGLFGSLGPPLRRFVRNEPSSRTSVHAAASCPPGLSRTTLHSRRGSFAAMHALGTASLSRVVQVHRPTLSAATPPRSARTVRRAFALRRGASRCGVFTDRRACARITDCVVGCPAKLRAGHPCGRLLRAFAVSSSRSFDRGERPRRVALLVV